MSGMTTELGATRRYVVHVRDSRGMGAVIGPAGLDTIRTIIGQLAVGPYTVIAGPVPYYSLGSVRDRIDGSATVAPAVTP